MEKDIIVTCPYNKSHRIRKCKLTTHMVKCKKQYDKEDKVTCPLNNGHVVDSDRLAEHIASCSNLSCLVESNIVEEKSNVPPIEIDMSRSDENWNELPEVPTYNAMEHSAKRKVIRCVSGLTKSEKKQFRMNEEIRIANLNAINNTAPLLSLPKNMVQEAPLRPPRNTAEALHETETTQSDSNKQDAQKYDCGANEQAKPTEFRNTFHRTLYNELLSDCEFDTNQEDNAAISNRSQYLKPENYKETKNALMKKLLETSHCRNDTVYNKSLNSSVMSARDYSQDFSIGEVSFSIGNQGYDTKVTKEQANVSEINTTHELDVDNSMKENASTGHASNVNISSNDTDKLLALLKNDTSVSQEEQTLKSDITESKHEKLDSKWEEIMKDFNRLSDLTDIQNAASEQKALIAKQLNDLTMLKNYYMHPSDDNIACDPRYAERVLPRCETRLNTVSEQVSLVKDTPSAYEYGACGYTDMSNINDNENRKLHKLKTPNDFRRSGDF